MNNNLDKIFNPKSIAIVGASRNPNAVGHGVLKNLVRGCVFHSSHCRPFQGKVYPINPNAKSILGVHCYDDLKSVPSQIDLAVICVPAKLVPRIIQDCAVKKVKGAVIISAGFAEYNEEGKELQEKVISIAKKSGIRIIGPNCLGIMRTSNHMNASFAPSIPKEGNIAFLSQSGAIVDSVIDWAIEHRYGFSTIVSYGNRSDLDVPDFLEWLSKDKKTKAIALYIEGLKDGEEFIKVAKKVSKIKPIIALKGGKTDKGSKAISSHTGSLAGSYEIYKAAFEKAGVIIADTIEELFDNAKALAEQPPAKENGIAIITNAGGCGVICADACEEHGINVIELKESTKKKLDATGVMHPAYSRSNPLDIVGDALPNRYEAAINTLLAEPYIQGIIVIQTLQTMTDSLEDAKIVVAAQKKFKNKPIVCTYMGGKFSRPGIAHLEENNIPDFNDPAKAAVAMKALITRGTILKQN
jgi:acetate---CoA ligase (ADP-forming)